jgi:hypothetical protein
MRLFQDAEIAKNNEPKELTMMKFGYMINEQSVTLLFSDGKAEVLPIDRAGDVIKAINDGADEETIKALSDKAKAIYNYMDGKVEVQNGVVLYNGEPIHNVIVEKILDFANKGYPYKPLCAFLAKIMNNPSRRAIHELYKFLSNENLGITDSGTFMAYKAVRGDWTDKYSGNYDNHIGNTLEMPRNSVDDDCNVGCSYGFHVGSLKYVDGFKGAGDHVVIVEVDPADVVSVPTEDCGKVRVCRYKVVGEYTGPLPSYVHTEEPTGCKPHRHYPEGELKADCVEDCPLDTGEGVDGDDPRNCPLYDSHQCPYVECRLELEDDEEGGEEDDEL